MIESLNLSSLHVSLQPTHLVATMTPSKALFRSHLMQQFAATARNQSRPPLALAAASSSESRSSRRDTSSSTSSRFAAAATRGSSILDAPTSASKRTTSTVTDTPSDMLRQTEDTVGVQASSLQSLITSRHTQSTFSLVVDDLQRQHLKDALDRAIVCAQAAPNHHKTEPFLFKRMLAPSAATRQLAEIASQVVYQKKKHKDPPHAQAHADRKLLKWNQIPAFLVTLVQDNQEHQPFSTNDDHKYEPMDYMPPTTERQLEDVRRMTIEMWMMASWTHSIHFFFIICSTQQLVRQYRMCCCHFMPKGLEPSGQRGQW